MSAPLLTVDEERALDDLRGCGCCSDRTKAMELWPDTCPADEDGYVDHDYEDDCIAPGVTAAVKRIVRKARREAWDEGYQAGNLDGYFGTSDEKNPYGESE